MHDAEMTYYQGAMKGHTLNIHTLITHSSDKVHCMVAPPEVCSIKAKVDVVLLSFV